MFIIQSLQNCGARPQGPWYPKPSEDATGDPVEAAHCDIIRDKLYVTGYECKTTCQEWFDF